jgi:hypothetical protein
MNGRDMGKKKEEIGMTEPHEFPTRHMYHREQTARQLDKIMGLLNDLQKMDIPPLAKVEIYRSILCVVTAQRWIREMGEPILPPEL